MAKKPGFKAAKAPMSRATARRLGRTALKNADPNLLPLIASRVSARQIPAVTTMTDIAAGRGGPAPWAPLGDQVARALGLRAETLPDKILADAVNALPRTALFMSPEARKRLVDSDLLTSPGAIACVTRASSQPERADALADSILNERDPFKRDGGSLLAPLLKKSKRSRLVDIILADDSVAGTRGWMDLANDSLLTASALTRIEQTIRNSPGRHRIVDAAVLAPLIDSPERREALLQSFRDTDPATITLPGWQLGAMLMRIGALLDSATLNKWLAVLETPYREYLERALPIARLGDDPLRTAPGLAGMVQASPDGVLATNYLATLSDGRASKVTSEALFKMLLRYGGAEAAAAPPAASSAARPAAQAESRSKYMKRVRARPPVSDGQDDEIATSAEPDEVFPPAASEGDIALEADDFTGFADDDDFEELAAEDGAPGDFEELEADGGAFEELESLAFDDAASPEPGSPASEPSPAALGSDHPAATAMALQPNQPPPPRDRFVQSAVEIDGQRRKSFVAGLINELVCWIGPDDKQDPRVRAVADKPVDEDAVPSDGLMLEVVLSYEQQSWTSEVFLPKDPRSASTECFLQIQVPDDERHLVAEVAFLHKGRVFELVRIDAPVAESEDAAADRGGLRVKTQLNRRDVIELSDRDDYDAVAVASDQGVAIFGPRGSARYSFDHAQDAIDFLNAELFATQKSLVRRQEDDAREPRLDAADKELLAFFRDMAIHGNELHKELKHSRFEDPGERIQIHNMEPKSYIPLEFVYDRGHPIEGAPFCDSWEAALAGDSMHCPSCKPAAELTPDERDQMPVICPLGFWSLQKIIERHDKLPDEVPGDTAAPVDAIAKLPPIELALIASSDKVEEADRNETIAVVSQCIGRSTTAETWPEWKQQVKNGPPNLIVAMPHHKTRGRIDVLEIGNKDELTQDRLNEIYVTRVENVPGPIVVAFGCETQVKAEVGYVGFARDFSRHRASIVIGTLAKVLGRHAAPVTQSLVRSLASIDKEEKISVTMRRLRRRMLARGYLMALCLVALGDGDWRLTPRKQPGAEHVPD